MTETIRPSALFGVDVFDRQAMRERLPRDIYEQLISSVEGGSSLGENVANAVAMAMKEWAISRGATHYTHWFQPRTEVTAEKHMAFLSLDKKGYPLETFTGGELIQSEPDASSLPSGGLRATFEARGYTAWDPTSPAFLVQNERGATLCIPCIFISFDGTPLDLKAPLLKALTTIDEKSMRLIKLFGNRSVKWVHMTVGAEQEFFLIDEDVAKDRPDILYCGRTIFGKIPPKGQQMEDHYFGSINPRVLAYMEEVENELTRLGVVTKTRHNEVAPCQFEFAPLHSEANLGSDQNQITMETMRKLAKKHGFRLLLHEKPFAELNGSGKHTNFSLVDSEGRNLLNPSSNPRRNLQFMAVLSAFLLGVTHYSGLLRACIASTGNMFRLGGNEAPPTIMSVYLGDFLAGLLDKLEAESLDNLSEKGLLDFGLNRLPTIQVDNTDRNRTAPIAFTGNKFEFRATGSSQSISGPLTMNAAIWAWGMDRMADMIENRLGEMDITEAALDAIREAAIESRKIRFEGNCYSLEWRDEAIRRGLPLAETTPEALALYLIPENRALLADMNIMSDREVLAYYEIRMEQYIKTLDIEIATMNSMIWEGVLPAIARQVKLESEALALIPDDIRPQTDRWKAHILRLVTLRNGLAEGIERLMSIKKSIAGLELDKQAQALTLDGLPLMEAIRARCDEAEEVIAAEFWPYPHYRELLCLK